jgi:hypothetical protein
VRCASPAAPSPPGLASLRRRSIGEIAAVTLDLWEP